MTKESTTQPLTWAELEVWLARLGLLPTGIGGWKRLSYLLGVTTQAITNWRANRNRRGIPEYIVSTLAAYERLPADERVLFEADMVRRARALEIATGFRTKAGRRPRQ